MTAAGCYSLISVVLFAKMFALSLVQGDCRISRLQFQVPGDARRVGRVPAADELPQVQRAQQDWRKDLENIPAFFGLGAA